MQNYTCDIPPPKKTHLCNRRESAVGSITRMYCIPNLGNTWLHLICMRGMKNLFLGEGGIQREFKMAIITLDSSRLVKMADEIQDGGGHNVRRTYSRWRPRHHNVRRHFSSSFRSDLIDSSDMYHGLTIIWLDMEYIGHILSWSQSFYWTCSSDGHVHLTVSSMYTWVLSSRLLYLCVSLLVNHMKTWQNNVTDKIVVIEIVTCIFQNEWMWFITYSIFVKNKKPPGKWQFSLVKGEWGCNVKWSVDGILGTSLFSLVTHL